MMYGGIDFYYAELGCKLEIGVTWQPVAGETRYE